MLRSQPVAGSLGQREGQAVGNFDRVRPDAAHLANQMLGADWLDRAVDLADTIHPAAGQKVGRRRLRAALGAERMWAKLQNVLRYAHSVAARRASISQQSRPRHRGGLPMIM
ncbi:MAG: hypothetical protein U0Z44_07350 [Kouleothrix sp.]